MTLSSSALPSLPTVAPASSDLHPYRLLEMYLQRQWQKRRREPVPLQIRCTYRQNRLLVLVEHAQGVAVDPRFTLGQLALALQNLEPKLRHALFAIQAQPGKRMQDLPIALYLRLLGEEQPYTAGGYTLKAPVQPSGDPETRSRIQNDRPTTTPTQPRPKPQGAPKATEEDSFHLPSGVWLAGAILCLSTFTGSFWFMMQPCHVRPCTPLLEAQQLQETALDQLDQAESWDDLKEVERQLQGAKTRLKQVPFWSSYRQEARQIEAVLTQDLDSFTPLTTAFQQVVQAVNQSENPPYTVEQWQAIQGLWEQALAQLRSITPNQPAYELAQRKIRQYEGYLAQITEELTKEQAADLLLTRAERSAQLAQIQKNRVLNPSSHADVVQIWDQAAQHWKQALEILQDVPQDTSAYAMAQERKKRYQQELEQAETQARNNQAGSDAFMVAQERADLAEAAAQEGRWALARNHWEVAIVNLQRVPSENGYFDQAQSLLPLYNQAFQRSDQQVRQFAQIETTRTRLDELCNGDPKICYYTATPELIAVQLTLDYESQVLGAGVAGDSQTRQQVIKHLQVLENSLETISNDTGIPLELYDPDGAMVGSHQPQA